MVKLLMKWKDYGEKFITQSYRDKTTIDFLYIYQIAFWLLENSTTLLAPNE